MIQVVNRALDILEFCSRQPDKSFTLSEIADLLELNHGTCANILKTLVDRKYIEQEGYKKGYRLGSMSYYLTKNFSPRTSLVELARPIMKELCDLLNETVIVAVYNKHDNKRIILHSEFTDQELQVRSGKEKDAYDTSTGRLLIACLSLQEREDIIKTIGLPAPHIWREASTRDGFMNELDKIKKTQIAFQKTATHVMGVAVPVFYHQKAIASLGIYLPDIRFQGDLKKIMINNLVHSAKQLSDLLADSSSNVL
jgi:DNA-binding IclR family transcriptional regulator